MFYTYVIQSLVDPVYLYKGHCENLEARLKEHNQKRTRSNGHKAPFKLVYYEEFESLEEAIRRKKYFKTAAGRGYLRKKIGIDSAGPHE